MCRYVGLLKRVNNRSDALVAFGVGDLGDVGFEVYDHAVLLWRLLVLGVDHIAHLL